MPFTRSLKDRQHTGASNAHHSSKRSLALPSVPALQKTAEENSLGIRAGNGPVQMMKTVVNRATGVERQEPDNYVLRWGEKFKDEPAPVVVTPAVTATTPATAATATTTAETEVHDQGHDDADHDDEEEAPTFEFQINKSARKHYNKPYASTYKITSDEQLKAFINSQNDVEVTSDQDIDLGSVTIGGQPKDCNVMFRNEWDGNHCVIYVWHCGPNRYRYN